MADEEKDLLDEEVEEESDTETEEEDQDRSQDDIDYEAEAKAEEERGKPDPAKAKESFKERQQRREAEGEEGVDDDKPLTRKDLLEWESRIISQTQKATDEQKAETIARGLAESDAEARAIIAKWKNRQFPSGMSLTEQLEEMHAAVNRKRLLSKNAELARANKSKGMVSHDTASTHRDPPQAAEPKLSAADKVGYAGYAWDGTKRLYKKPIQGGKKHVWKDPKTKQSWVA